MPVYRGKFAINLLANVGQLGLTTLIGLWYVPFLIRNLGPGVYGLLPLATTLTSYMSLVTLVLNSAVGRSMTIALEQGDTERANRIFNTSFWASLLLGAILLIPAAIAVFKIDSLVRIPPDYLEGARWLFVGTVAAFLLNEFKSPFEISSFCRNRFDLRNLVAASEVFVRVGLVVLLFYTVAPRIQFVGLGIFCGTVVSTLGAVTMCRRLIPSLRLQWGSFDLHIFKELTTTGGWVMINQLGALLYLGIDLLVANRLFGAEQSGRYAALLQLALLLRTLGSTIGAVFSPTVLYLYAENDIKGLVLYLRRAIKFIGLLLGLPIALLCGFSEQLLGLWLGPSFESLGPLLALLCIHLCINMAINPLLGLQLATNRMKVPAIVTVVMGMGNFGLALLLAGPMGWGLYGIAAAGAIMLTLKNVFFTPVFAAYILKQPLAVFVRGLVPIVAVTLVAIGMCRLLALQVPLSSWLHLFGAGLVVSVIYCSAVLMFMLDDEEKSMLKKYIPRGTQATESA